MIKVGHLLSKLHRNRGVELNFRDLTNKFTKQNSITSFEFESGSRWPTFVSLKFALFKSALNKDLLYYLLLKVLNMESALS